MAVSSGEALNLTLKTVVRRFIPLFVAVFVCVLPAVLLRTYMPIMMQEELGDIRPEQLIMDFDKLGPVIEKLAGIAIVGLEILFAFFALTILSQAVVVGVTRRALQNEDAQLGDSFREGFDRFPTVAVISLLEALAIALGSLFCFVPGLVLAAALHVSVPAAVIERLGIAEALGRSWDLTRGYRGSVLGALSALAVVMSIAMTGTSVVASSLTGSPPTISSMVWVQGITSLMLVAFSAGFAVLASVFYLRIVADRAAKTPQLRKPVEPKLDF